MKIRQSTPSDRAEILEIHNLSFGTEEGPVIAKLVDDLFEDVSASPILSLVAEIDDQLLGHILFTKAIISQTEASVSAQLLAPLAVIPKAQGKGIGSELINEGLRQLNASGIKLVFVLGHPTYYPRCGFNPAGKVGFEAPYPIPEKNADAWMVLELNGDALGNVRGKVQCCDALDKPQYWRE